MCALYLSLSGPCIGFDEVVQDTFTECCIVIQLGLACTNIKKKSNRSFRDEQDLI
jgi:hypothetical protein